MDTISTFSKRLKDLRKERNINQEQLAKEIGASRGSISFYEKGSRIPDISILDKLANYFNVSTDYLLGRTSEKMNNIEIQTIQNMTGLNNEAINKLMIMKKNNKFHMFDNILGAINYLIGEELMIENNMYGGILLNIGEYLFEEFMIPSPSDIEKLEKNETEIPFDELEKNASTTLYYLTKSKEGVVLNYGSAASLEAITLVFIQNRLIELRKKISGGDPYGDRPETR